MRAKVNSLQPDRVGGDKAPKAKGRSKKEGVCTSWVDRIADINVSSKEQNAGEKAQR